MMVSINIGFSESMHCMHLIDNVKKVVRRTSLRCSKWEESICMLRHPHDQPASTGVAEKWCRGPDANMPLMCENPGVLLLQGPLQGEYVEREFRAMGAHCICMLPVLIRQEVRTPQVIEMHSIEDPLYLQFSRAPSQDDHGRHRWYSASGCRLGYMLGGQKKHFVYRVCEVAFTETRLHSVSKMYPMTSETSIQGFKMCCNNAGMATRL